LYEHYYISGFSEYLNTGVEGWVTFETTWECCEIMTVGELKCTLLFCNLDIFPNVGVLWDYESTGGCTLSIH
jgi:hypothetical protein